jgi:phage terminase large subunit-like protein
MDVGQIANIVNSREGRRAMVALSPIFFMTYHLGLDYAEHQDNWLNKIEQLIKDAKRTNEKRKLLLLAPRDHGKSFLSICVTLRALCLNRDTKILWISASSAQAEKRVRLVKEYLSNERIVEDFASQDLPPFITPKTKITATQLYLNRAKESVDPSVEAVGSGGKITGAHVDMIIMDDLEDDKTTYSSGVREKQREWLKMTIEPMLSQGGFMLVVGTRKHFDDVYAHMLRDSTFQIINDPAIKKMPSHHQFVMGRDEYNREVIERIDCSDDAEVLWKEHRPIEKLLLQKQSMGTRGFAREFQNQVQDGESAVFKWEWLEACKRNWISYGDIPEGKLTVVQGWDLALKTNAKEAEKADSDYTVGTTLAKDENGNRFILSIFRARGLTPSQLRQAVIDEYCKFPQGMISTVVIEKNAFGQLHLLNLKETTDLPLRAHLTTAGNKQNSWSGVTAMGALFENGKFFLPYQNMTDMQLTDALCGELFGLGKEAHDDMVMSLWIAESAIRSQSFQYSFSMGENEYSGQGALAHTDTKMLNYSQEADKQVVKGIWSSFDFYDGDENE